MMSHKTKKLIALLLALLMLVGSVPAVFAAETASEEDTTDSEFDSFATIDTEQYTLIEHVNYEKKYGLDTEETLEKLRTGESVSVAATDYLDSSTAVEEVTEWYGKEAIIMGDTGSVTWELDVPETGAYCVRFQYCAASDKTTDIERIFKINGKAISSETRYQTMLKSWILDYSTELDTEKCETNLRADAQNGQDKFFQYDIPGNEIRPKSHAVYEWSYFSVQDRNGYRERPFEFYLEKGINTITLEGVRDTIAIASVELYTYEPLPTYEDVLKEYEKKGYKSAENSTIKLEAELPESVSNYTIYPVYDRVSSISSPQDSAKVYRNTIGGDKWLDNNQWIKYKFICEETGLYQISIRYLQDQLSGLYSSRALKINGEYPFEEAKSLQFVYSSQWENVAATDGNYVFSFYFEKGETYELEFEVTLGNFTDVARQVSSVMSNLNDDYMSILELAGNDADENRDYGFARIMPDVIKNLAIQSSILYQLVDYIIDVNGGKKSENTSSLEQAASIVEKMASDEREIAAGLTSLKEQVTALGTWLDTISDQYLMMDYITISPVGSEIPNGTENALSSFAFEISKFFSSFYTDYNAMGSVEVETTSSEEVLAWTSSGRDQMQIMKTLITTGYTQKTGENVVLKLVDGGTMLPAILTGTGPDMSMDAGTPIDYAIRGAILSLNERDGFEEVMKRFADSAIITISLYGKTYALPTSQDCSMMFVRDDIITGLGLSVPETWDDILAMIPVLQFNNMQIGLTADAIALCYQQGIGYWKDEGMATNIDSYEYMENFATVCGWFTQYSLPVSYSAQNVFKTGEIPIMLSAYTFYNTLSIFAPEISGLWHFYRYPGTRKADGTVDHTTISGVSGVWMPICSKNQDGAWKFMKWVTDVEYQVGYSDEMVALLGPSAKQAVANLNALEQLPWTNSEYQMIKTCLQDTKAVEPYPGSYYISRWVGFAFNAAYNDGDDPTKVLSQYIDGINAEITRKRTEFELMVTDEWEAIKDYTGFTEFSEWREYWSELNDVPYDSATAIQDNQGNDNNYTYVNWMKDHNVNVSNHEAWKKAKKNDDTTLTYKEWTEK